MCAIQISVFVNKIVRKSIPWFTAFTLQWQRRRGRKQPLSRKALLIPRLKISALGGGTNSGVWAFLGQRTRPRGHSQSRGQAPRLAERRAVWVLVLLCVRYFGAPFVKIKYSSAV